jgi:hypothetical protein
LRRGTDWAVAEVAEVDKVVLVVDSVELEVHSNLCVGRRLKDQYC